MSGAAKCFNIDLGKLYNPYGNRVLNTFNPRTQERETVKMCPISIFLKPAPGYEKYIFSSPKNKTVGNEGGDTGRPKRTRKKVETQPKVAAIKQSPNNGNPKSKPKPKPRSKSKPAPKKTKVENTEPQPPQIKRKPGPARKRKPTNRMSTVPSVAASVELEPQAKFSYGAVKIKTEPVEIMVPINPESLLFEGMPYLSPYGGSLLNISQNDPVDALANPHQPDGYECPTCSETFLIQEDLFIHRRSHRFSYSCSQCTKIFDTQGALATHAKAHAAAKKKKDALNNGHATNPLDSFDNRPYSPPPVTFAELSESSIACDACGESFNDNQSLKVHYMGHFGLVETPMRSQTQIVNDDESRTGTDQERNLVVFGMNTFQTPNSVGSSEQKQIELAYNDFLIKTEGLKRDAFQLNNPALLNKMLEVESLVATMIIQLRGPVSYSPNGIDVD